MQTQYSAVIKSIEDNIAIKYLPGCIQWADKNHNNAWSNAIQDFEEALEADWADKEKAGEIYLGRCLDLIEKFKSTFPDESKWEQVSFLNEIRFSNPK